jgi:hypothetical protein
MTLTQVSLVVSAKSGIAPTVVDAEEDILNDAKNRVARVILATVPMRLIKLKKPLVIFIKWHILFSPLGIIFDVYCYTAKLSKFRKDDNNVPMFSDHFIAPLAPLVL